MTPSKNPPVVYHVLDPADGRAMLHAVDRLPAQALQAGSEPLTPSLRSVLDRFLSVPLRHLLRSLGPVDGPAAVVVDGLNIDGSATGGAHDAGRLGQRPGLAPAMMVWLAEAAGLFPVERADERGIRPNHQMLWIPVEPPADAAPIGFAAVNQALCRLDPGGRRLVNDRRFRSADTTDDGTGQSVSSLVTGLAPTAGLAVEPDLVVGIDAEAEAFRHQFLDALSSVEVEVGPWHGRLILADGRRGHLRRPVLPHPTARPEPWSEQVALTPDPRADTSRAR